MKTSDFDTAFDNNTDIDDQIDWSKARRISPQTRRVNVDFPLWVVEALDAEAGHLGVTRQSLIKMWIAERLPRAG